MSRVSTDVRSKDSQCFSTHLLPTGVHIVRRNLTSPQQSKQNRSQLYGINQEQLSPTLMLLPITLQLQGACCSVSRDGIVRYSLISFISILKSGLRFFLPIRLLYSLLWCCCVRNIGGSFRPFPVQKTSLSFIEII